VSLLAELEQIDRALVSKRLAVARLDARIAQVESEIERLEGRRGRVAEDLVRQQAALSARLETLARLAMAPAGPGWPPDPEGLRRRLAANDLARVTQDDLARLTRYDETAERLAARQAAVARGRQELVALRRAVDRERAEVAGHADRRRELLREVKDDRTTHERMAAELTEASRRLEALVRSLARRPPPVRRAVARPSVPAAPRGPAVGLERERGHLPWPVEGRVIGEFGPQVNPRFGTETVRPGIDIEAPEGAPIRAVAPATVAYRGWLKGYGNLVILDHGDGFHTLYAHASTVLVDEGETVRAGGVIGRVGETGSVDGPRLHFEVRSQGRAEDPRQWLSGRP
jgi:septal ring factor EnvC (AmiA/AmiB activator)